MRSRREEGLATSEVDALSGLTNDIKVLEHALRAYNDRRVRLAIEAFATARGSISGAFLASMGGADAIVFSGGIGEHSPEACAHLRGHSSGPV